MAGQSAGWALGRQKKRRKEKREERICGVSESERWLIGVREARDE